MDILINIGIYLGVVAALVVAVIGGIYIKRKFDLKDEDLECAKLVLNIIDTMASKSTIKYKGEISTVVKYVVDALMFVEEFEKVDSLRQKKELIANKALEICEENGIRPDPDLLQLIDQVVEYFI